MKGFSHNLTRLCEYTGIKFEDGSVHSRIMSFLNSFAVGSRYYNLDSMLDKNTKYDDPMKEWDLIAADILLSAPKRKHIQNKQALAELIDSCCMTRFTDLQGNEINSFEGILDDFESRDIIQGYSVQYVFEIITKIVSEIHNLEDRRNMMPVLSEFFIIYNQYLKPAEIRNKKDWLRI